MFFIYISQKLVTYIDLPKTKRYNYVINRQSPERFINTYMNEDICYEILSAVEEIPYGKVSTYGEIARLIGREKNARLVGRVLSHAEMHGDYPCHRVVSSTGRTAPGWYEQRLLLENEGVEFLKNGNVDLKRFLWDGDSAG